MPGREAGLQGTTPCKSTLAGEHLQANCCVAR